jgi:hypothetical protein
MLDQPLGRSFTAFVGLLITAVMLAGILGASIASAAPTEPTLGVAALTAKIEAAPGNVVPGYMKTVMRGATIETIPVDVLAVTTAESLTTGGGGLILIRATGPEIDAVGGIVAGMSGSPVYVNDFGTDKLIGAVSYGDTFTLGGTGLATPIEQMAQLEVDHPMAAALHATGGVRAASAPHGRISVAFDAATAARLGGRRTMVAKPLMQLMVGGLAGDNPVFKAYRSHMASIGIDVVPSVAAAGSGDPSFSTPLVGGASVGFLASRGSYWTGGVGTVTYVNGNTLVAFGHPVFWEGDTGLDMTNAWVNGVWPSFYEPYKVAEPGALRGTFTQDRGAGVMGVIGTLPPETPITAEARNVDNGRVGTATTWMPRFAIDSASYNYAGTPSIAAYTAATQIFDSVKVPGSAVTTTTVVVDDGINPPVTLVRRNVFDDPQDITQRLVGDVSEMVTAFQSVNENGLAHADILSVDLQSDITSRRNTMDLADIEAPDGLTWGDNRVRVSLFRYGVEATETLETTLTIPDGMPLQGQLSAAPQNGGYSYGGGIYDVFFSSSSSANRDSVKDVVDYLNSEQSNSVLIVTYQPDNTFNTGGSSSGSYNVRSSVATDLPDVTPTGRVTQTISTSSYLTGAVSKNTTVLTASTKRRTAAYGGSATIVGTISGLLQPATVTITGRVFGDDTETVLGHADVVGTSSIGTFSKTIHGLRRNMVVTVRFDGDDKALASSTEVPVDVAAGVSLRTSARLVRGSGGVTLTASIRPSDAGGSVAFERRKGRRWVVIGSRWLSASGNASMSWRPPAGTSTLRAHYRGGITNVGADSRTVVVRRR